MGNKLIYILGAGASKTVGLPLQNELLSIIFSIKFEDILIDSDDFMSMNTNDCLQNLVISYIKFDKYRRKLGEFITANFSSQNDAKRYNGLVMIGEDTPDHLQKKNEYYYSAYDIVKCIKITLEDIFTLFDNVSLGREHFRLYSPEEIDCIHKELKLCIIYALSYKTYMSNDNNAYDKFAKIIIEKRLKYNQKYDELSIISMNWDDSLEQKLYKLCDNYNLKKDKRSKDKIYPDLCFYDYPLNQAIENRIVSTHVKAKGYRNIKILKMHGSLGWLVCPKCSRLLVDYNSEISMNEFLEKKCPYCNKDINDKGPKLHNLIITPTFLKELSDLNLKNIWHNASIDLSESKEIIFIGYSFPNADFEMRCLLKKAVNENVDIKVILHESDNPKKYLDMFLKKGFTDEDSRLLVAKMSLPENRYKSFFGNKNIEFHYEGFENYVNQL